VETRQGFANAIAYYMKLTYSNWHKELVHDDNIQTELSAITKGELEFNNRPFIKHRVDNREEFGGNTGKYRKNFGGRTNRGNQPRDNQGRDNRGSNRNKFSKKRY
jgi:hypothetical protein